MYDRFPILNPPWLRFSNYTDKLVMAIQAHPDDADWACGGVMARCAAAGARLVYVVATKGEAGTDDPEMTKERLTQIREQEQRDANAILGVRETIFLGHSDGRLRNATALETQLAALIRERRPSLILTFDPEWSEYTMHPDHYAIALATVRAAQFSGLTLTFVDDAPAQPYVCPEILVWEPKRPNIRVDITEYSCAKLEALAAHRSQMAHMLPKPLHKLMYDLVARGNRPEVRLLLRIIHPMFRVETFRRLPGRTLLH